LRTIYQGCRALPFALAGLSCLAINIDYFKKWICWKSIGGNTVSGFIYLFIYLFNFSGPATKVKIKGSLLW